MATFLMRSGAFSLSLHSCTSHLSFLQRSFSALRRRPLRSSTSGVCADSKVMLKEMDFSELDKWVQSNGFRSGQAMMLWKCLYGNNTWALSHDELEGLNKDFRKMIDENASLKALTVKDVLKASDGTRKVMH